jgi:hypothetical protein
VSHVGEMGVIFFNKEISTSFFVQAHIHDVERHHATLALLFSSHLHFLNPVVYGVATVLPACIVV